MTWVGSIGETCNVYSLPACGGGLGWGPTAAMNDQWNETMTLSDDCKTGPVILVAEGGLQNTLSRSSDPIADWIDLMETVEALCPKWPAPEPPRVGWVYRL